MVALNRVFLAAVAVSLFALSAYAQQDAGDGTDNGAEKTWGDYSVHQSIELGYRYRSITGNENTYDTFVDLSSGFRLLNQSLNLQSLDHNGFLFDNLSLTNFGYFGDPNNVTRLRIEKNKLYNFSAMFRRDKNFWNYNLLANPLNPVASNPAVPITSSPKSMDLVRRMSDFQLTLLPQSKFRTRLGYSHSANEGPSFTSLDSGTQPLLSQNWRTHEDSYRFGFDLLTLPKTRFSYDQFFDAFKQDTSWTDNNLTFQLPNGQPVDLGIVWDTLVNGTPCSPPVFVNPATTPPTANPGCNGFEKYSRFERPRTFFPTEQFSFQTGYIRNVTMSGRFTYSTADSRVNDYGEFILGLTTRTNEQQITSTGPADTRRVSASADWNLVWAVTPKLRVVDTFRWDNFRLPGSWTFANASLFTQGDPNAPTMLLAPAIFNAGNCPPPFTATTCPQHNGSSGADVATGRSILFFGQDLKSNTLRLEYDFSPRFGAHIGYRYEHREITQRDTEFLTEQYYPGGGPAAGGPAGANRNNCALDQNNNLPPGCVDNGDGTFTFMSNGSDGEFTPINAHTALFGFWAKPMHSLKINADVDLMSADRSFMRTSPRQQQHYRINAHYISRSWASLSTNFDIVESRDNIQTVNYLAHNRAYSFALALQPGGRYSFDLGYTYNNVFSQADICYFLGFSPPPTPCPTDTVDFNAIGAVSFYKNTTHTAYGDVMWHPAKRVMALIGYVGTFTTGNTLFLNPNSPFGPLRFTFQKPYASVTIDLAKGLFYKMGWNYYGYNEKSQPGFTGSRDFNGNSSTFSVGYSF